MTAYITDYPNESFHFSVFGGKFGKFNVNLNENVKSRLKEGEELTNEKAVSILKTIRWQSKLKSWMTKPIVLIPLGLALVTASFFIPFSNVATVINVALVALRLLTSMIGGGILGFSIQNGLNGFLPRLSKAYANESQSADELIKKLEEKKDLQVSFPNGFLDDILLNT